MNILKKLPLPISGLMLGLAALGNLVGPYSSLLRTIFGSVSALIGVLLILKMILFRDSLAKAFENPVVGSVMAAFPMGLMLLSVYIKPLTNFAFILWCFAIILHILFIAVFTKKYILKFDIKKVFPSYFVMYVGIICGSVTSPAYQMQNVGQILFWFGFISYLLLLPIMTYRVIVIKNMPKPSLPTKIIFSAPASLCLVGYMNAFTDKNPIIIYLLSALSITMLVYALIQLPKLLKLPFMPSYSAFTFPLVISGIAVTIMSKYFNNEILRIFSISMVFISSALVIYVLIRYTLNLFKHETVSQSVKKAV